MKNAPPLNNNSRKEVIMGTNDNLLPGQYEHYGQNPLDSITLNRLQKLGSEWWFILGKLIYSGKKRYFWLRSQIIPAFE